MPQDPYGEFAEIYDDWQSLYPRPFSLALAPRIAAAIRTRKAPIPVLADLACGTGTFALWWQKRYSSWTVYGSDRSEAMINAAKKESAAGHRRRNGKGKTPEFFVQELRDLRLPEPVGAITCLFDSLNHVTRTAELARVFRRVRENLVPRGLFLFDLVDELVFPEVFSGSSILEGKGLYLGMESEYWETDGKGYGEARFTFFRAPTGRVALRKRNENWRRVFFTIRERRWFRGEIRDLLADAGLDLIRLERIDPYASKEFFVPRTFWTCRRGK